MILMLQPQNQRHQHIYVSCLSHLFLLSIILPVCAEKEDEKGEGERKNIYAVDKIFQFNEDYYNFNYFNIK